MPNDKDCSCEQADCGYCDHDMARESAAAHARGRREAFEEARLIANEVWEYCRLTEATCCAIKVKRKIRALAAKEGKA